MSDRDLGLPNELDVDPEVALGRGRDSAEPPLRPIGDPADPDFVEPAPHAVPAPEDVGR